MDPTSAPTAVSPDGNAPDGNALDEDPPDGNAPDGNAADGDDADEDSSRGSASDGWHPAAESAGGSSASTAVESPDDGGAHDCGAGVRVVSLDDLTGDGASASVADERDAPEVRVARFDGRSAGGRRSGRRAGGSTRSSRTRSERPDREARSGSRGGASGGGRGRASQVGGSEGVVEPGALEPGSAADPAARHEAGAVGEDDGGSEGRSGRRGGRSGKRGSGSGGGLAFGPQDDESRAKEICLRLLTDRARTVQELAQALRRKEIPDDVANRVLERFDEVGLVDDEAFAAQWVRSRHHHRGLGRRAIAAELHRKGVAKEIADEALTEVDTESEEARARELVDRKLRTAPIGTKEQRASTARRLVGMLARKGYGPNVAYRVVREAIAERGAEEDELGEGPLDD